MMKCCYESTWSSLCFCPVSFVWLISPSFCRCNSPCRTVCRWLQSEPGVNRSWGIRPLENLGDPRREVNLSLTSVGLPMGAKPRSTFFKQLCDQSSNLQAEGIQAVVIEVAAPVEQGFSPQHWSHLVFICKRDYSTLMLDMGILQTLQPNLPETRIPSLCSGEQQYFYY